MTTSNNMITLKCGVLGSVIFHSPWGWVTLKKVQLIFDEKLFPYQVTMPKFNRDTTAVIPLSFVNTDKNSTHKSLMIPCDKIKNLKIQAFLTEKNHDDTLASEAKYSPSIPADIKPGEEFHIVVVSEKGTWNVQLVRDPKDVDATWAKALDDQRGLYCILRQVICKFPLETQFALNKAQEVIEQIDPSVLKERMTQIRGLQALQATKPSEEVVVLQRQITRLALDLIGKKIFAEIMDAATQCTLKSKFKDLQQQYEIISEELQQLCFPPLNEPPIDEISLYFCWTGPLPVKNKEDGRVILSFKEENRSISAPISSRFSDELIPFSIDGEYHVRLKTTSSDLNTFKINIFNNSGKTCEMTVALPPKWELGNPYCLQANIEGAAIIELSEFFDRNKIVFTIHDVMIKNLEYSFKYQFSDHQKAQLYLLIQKEIDSIPVTKVRITVEGIEFIADKMNYNFENPETFSEIFPLLFELLGEGKFEKITRAGISNLLFNQKTKLSKSETAKLNKKTKALFSKFQKLAGKPPK